ncbi:hypothetical protein CTRI78_v007807 [Colletotrichum trifolii]|uniref:Uncharacterized protein n=1 Tax=Colletotrichum trifolii TaxID=5466 RepID=A0A4R8R6A1_COLTR|nr:hypothetical protein CTRI78_v007807 [Colletotrichum trifolii]
MSASTPSCKESRLVSKLQPNTPKPPPPPDDLLVPPNGLGPTPPKLVHSTKRKLRRSQDVKRRSRGRNDAQNRQPDPVSRRLPSARAAHPISYLPSPASRPPRRLSNPLVGRWPRSQIARVTIRTGGRTEDETARFTGVRGNNGRTSCRRCPSPSTQHRERSVGIP